MKASKTQVIVLPPLPLAPLASPAPAAPPPTPTTRKPPQQQIRAVKQAVKRLPGGVQ